MNITITPTRLSGSVTPPPSKSQAHRLLIAAALADGESVLSNVALSEDIRATISCMEEMGAEFSLENGRLTVRGCAASAGCALRRSVRPHLDCGESGSTLRFLIPVALAVRGGGTFTGHGRLMERPLQPYFDLFDQKGVSYTRHSGTLTVCGTLSAGVWELPGNVSSQFITGLLYALPLLEGESTLRITTALESADYIAMTLHALRQFGITVEQENTRTYRIPGRQTYRPRALAVEADWSQAGFWYAAAGIGNNVSVTGMDPDSLQGDRVIAHFDKLLRNLPLSGGAECPIRGKSGTDSLASDGSRYAVSLDVAPCPDLAPPLAAWGALLHDASGRSGNLYLKNAGRLRMKESDRLAAVTAVLRAMGADITEGPDSLTIRGKERLPGGCTVDCWGDHRIAMMAAIAATRCDAPVTLIGAECVKKSYPNFWDDYEALGGHITRSEV